MIQRERSTQSSQSFQSPISIDQSQFTGLASRGCAPPPFAAMPPVNRRFSSTAARAARKGPPNDWMSNGGKSQNEGAN